MLPWEIVAQGPTQISEQDMGRLRDGECRPACALLSHHRLDYSVIQRLARGGQLRV